MLQRNKAFPNAFNIFITEKCNLDCRYCFVNKELQNSRLDFQDLKRAVDCFLNFPEEKKTISFNGGEPLLEYPLLKKIYLYIKKSAQKKNIYVDVAVMTNGTLLSKYHSNFFEKHKTIVKISIDGDQKTHDFNRPFKNTSQKSSWQKIIKNLKKINPSNLKLAASLVFTPQTIESFLENVKFLQKLGFSYIEFYSDMYSWWPKKDLIKFKKKFQLFNSYYISLFQKNRNHIFKNSLLDSIVNQDEVVGTKEISCRKIHLAPDGNFYFCDKIFSLPKSERKKYIIGNIRNGVDNQKRLKLLDTTQDNVRKLLKRRCDKCPHQQYCFCPIGHYIYFNFKGRNLKKEFNNFCSVAKIYFDSFLEIKEKLKYNPLFVKIYKF